jgi:hypothetical protein
MAYQYPSWWIDLSEEDILANSNGCGPGNWRYDLVPDALLGVNFEWPCRIHDVEYWRGKDKTEADARLLVNMLIACMEQHPDKMHKFAPLAYGYYESVRHAGHRCFGRG